MGIECIYLQENDTILRGSFPCYVTYITSKYISMRSGCPITRYIQTSTVPKQAFSCLPNEETFLFENSRWLLTKRYLSADKSHRLVRTISLVSNSSLSRPRTGRGRAPPITSRWQERRRQKQ